MSTSCAHQHTRSAPTTGSYEHPKSAPDSANSAGAANSAVLPYSNRRGNSPEGNQIPLPRPCRPFKPGDRLGRPSPARCPIVNNFGCAGACLRAGAPRQRRAAGKPRDLSFKPGPPRHDRHSLDGLSGRHARAHAGRDSRHPAQHPRPRPGHDPRPPARRQARVHRRRRRHERKPRLHRRQARGFALLPHRPIHQGTNRRHHAHRANV